MSWQGRNAVVVRQWRILVLLRQQPRTLFDIASALDINIRTARRDLDALSEVFPIRDACERGRGARTVFTLDAMDAWPRRAVAPIRELGA